jgi:hypothetical protein
VEWSAAECGGVEWSAVEWSAVEWSAVRCHWTRQSSLIGISELNFLPQILQQKKAGTEKPRLRPRLKLADFLLQPGMFKQEDSTYQRWKKRYAKGNRQFKPDVSF